MSAREELAIRKKARRAEMRTIKDPAIRNRLRYRALIDDYDLLLRALVEETADLVAELKPK